MAKNKDVRNDIANLLARRTDKISKAYIEDILVTYGYTDNKDSLRKTRVNIMKPLIEGGFIEGTHTGYIITKGLRDIQKELKEYLKNPDQDIKDLITQICKLGDKSDDRQMFGFAMAHTLHFNPKQIEINHKVQSLSNLITILSNIEIIDDITDERIVSR